MSHTLNPINMRDTCKEVLRLLLLTHIPPKRFILLMPDRNNIKKTKKNSKENCLTTKSTDSLSWEFNVNFFRLLTMKEFLQEDKSFMGSQNGDSSEKAYTDLKNELIQKETSSSQSISDPLPMQTVLSETSSIKI